jgi:XTP/dITP diphosphohydrolase
MELILASKNPEKVAEIREILRDSIKILSLCELPPVDIEEDGATYYENAEKKAKVVAHRFGLPALADDSGLEIEHLEKGPGVLSAKFGGNISDIERCKMVLDMLSGVPKERRGAKFVCVIAFADTNGKLYFTEGVVDGIIAEEMRGDNGFGYDPIFLYPPLNKTFAELELAEKNRISHRAKALFKMKEILYNLVG